MDKPPSFQNQLYPPLSSIKSINWTYRYPNFILRPFLKLLTPFQKWAKKYSHSPSTEYIVSWNTQARAKGNFFGTPYINTQTPDHPHHNIHFHLLTLQLWSFFVVKGIGSSKKLDSQKQLCAGHKIINRNLQIYEYSGKGKNTKFKKPKKGKQFITRNLREKVRINNYL